MKIALCIAYQGSAYHGWQRQEHHPSIQEAIETALSQMANHTVVVQCAGRTDAGVHASKQIVHFDTSTHRELFQWIYGTNSYLAKDIRVLYASKVDENFNARFSALEREYHYVIYHQAVESVFLKDRAMFSRLPLSIEKIEKASFALLGEHDFSAFRASQCQAKSPVRTMHSIQLKCRGDYIVLTFRANAFLHHMIRNIVGSLLMVGYGKQSIDWIKEVLMSKDRRSAGAMAPACGLYLSDIIYPEPYIFPRMPFPFIV